ncbi:topoisomerase DNA-binding C4 zinc finger domain-containing protein [Niallia sp. 01092]
MCPRCGSQLIVRKGKNGAFTGCSGFPKCRFTKAV